MRRRKRLGLDQRGGALALVAVTMVVLLGVTALAIDLAMGLAMRNEAQRIADSSALAGGSAYLDYSHLTDSVLAKQVAEARAYDYALRNELRKEAVDSSMVTVEIMNSERKVRVYINKPGIPTWFARILGIDEMDIGAVAAAQAVNAGTARCLKPLAIPDLWDEADAPDGQDDGDNVWEQDEEWVFEPPGQGNGLDRYERVLPNESNAFTTATGYGSTLRGPERDWGRNIAIKVSNPQSEFALNPGLFYPWRLPPDPNMEECDQGGGGSQDSGGATYRRNLCECNNSEIELFKDYDLEPGNMIGPTAQGIGELIDEDPTAVWNQSLDGGRGGIENSAFADPMESPRVIKVALFDIGQITGPGMQSIQFNNFALFFLESQANSNAPVLGRFMYFADGSDIGAGGNSTGSLTLILRLVE